MPLTPQNTWCATAQHSSSKLRHACSHLKYFIAAFGILLEFSSDLRRFHVYQRQPVEEMIEGGESLKESLAEELAEYLYFSDRAYDEPDDVKLQEKMEKRGNQ